MKHVLWSGTSTTNSVGSKVVGRSEYYDKKMDDANRDRSLEELKRLVKDKGQTQDQRESAQRVLKEGKSS